MAVAFRSASAVTKNTGSSAVPAAPSGVVAGDTLYAIQYVQYVDGVELASMTASGWTERFAEAATIGNQAVKIWSREATGSDTYAFAHPSTADCTVSVLCFTGADPNAELTVAIRHTGASSPHTAPSTTGKVDGMLICAFVTHQDSQGIVGTWTAPSGMTERTDTGISTCWVGMSTHTLPTTSTDATGIKTATLSRPYDSSALSFVIGPPSAVSDTSSLLSLF